MTAKDLVIVKRKYLKPMPPDPEFENMDKRTAHYKHKLTGKKFIIYNNLATQLACCDVDGAMFIEKYCDDCIKSKKHQRPVDFDNMFTKAEPGTANYDRLHAKNIES
jgi:hypothetical protein